MNEESVGLNAPVEVMKLTLTFDGLLSSSGNGAKRAENKWALRRSFHDQLKELWEIDPVLHEMERQYVPTHGGIFIKGEQYHGLPKKDLKDDSGKQERLYLFEPIEKHGKAFKPLVRNSAALICHLDILFLRRGRPGKVFDKARKSDLDNRLKTLFDGLRMPEHREEVGAGGEFEEPLYCLLEDDELVTGFSIRTGQLLTGSNKNPDEVRLVVEVTIKAAQVKTYNLAFQGD